MLHVLKEYSKSCNIWNFRLHRAAEQGRLAVVKAILSCKADPRAKDQVGRSPLHCAVFTGQAQVAECLLQHDASTSKLVDAKNQTPLHAAALGSSAECVRILLNHDAPVNARDAVSDVTSFTIIGVGDQCNNLFVFIFRSERNDRLVLCCQTRQRINMSLSRRSRK